MFVFISLAFLLRSAGHKYERIRQSWWFYFENVRAFILKKKILLDVDFLHIACENRTDDGAVAARSSTVLMTLFFNNGAERKWVILCCDLQSLRFWWNLKFKNV